MKNEKVPLISIITVGMNHLQYLKDLLSSLYIEYSPSISFEMIYIDNCSNDNSTSFIRKNYPQVQIYQNEKIKGFGENNNYGVSKARGKYIAVINPDIIILKNSIDNLYNYMINYPETGIVVPQLLNSDYSIQYSVRAFITLKSFIYRLLSCGKDSSNNKYIKEYLQKDMDNSQEQLVDWAIGAAMFFDKEFFLQLNGFDQNYFLYMEDEDICIRSWKKGRPVVYFPESHMVHNHLRGSSKIGKKTWLHIKSLIIFFKKHGCNVKRPCINIVN